MLEVNNLSCPSDINIKWGKIAEENDEYFGISFEFNEDKLFLKSMYGYSSTLEKNTIRRYNYETLEFLDSEYDYKSKQEWYREDKNNEVFNYTSITSSLASFEKSDGAGNLVNSYYASSPETVEFLKSTLDTKILAFYNEFLEIPCHKLFIIKENGSYGFWIREIY